MSTPPEPQVPGAPLWLEDLIPAVPVEQLGPRQLAWLGDAVWELHQRLRLCRQPSSPRVLHLAAVEGVRAAAQARALHRLDSLLQEREREWVRRGRNGAGRPPRSVDPALYGEASGFETMVGWLFLQDRQRLAQLLDHLDQSDPSPRSAPRP